ncbi:MAG: nucleotidyltransferase family protein [Peptococcaceae bacterium]|nr:nucleotidyltransferase family protein [Peptococcaceae bacterium]
MKKLRDQKPLLREQYGVNSFGIFGSYVRGEQNKKSDVDILIDLSRPISLFGLIDLEDQLSKLIGKKVDLVLKDELKPRIGERILREVIYI